MWEVNKVTFAIKKRQCTRKMKKISMHEHSMNLTHFLFNNHAHNISPSAAFPIRQSHQISLQVYYVKLLARARGKKF